MKKQGQAIQDALKETGKATRDAWVPAPNRIDNILAVEDQFVEGETIEIAFKRFDMTDEEMDALPVE